MNRSPAATAALFAFLLAAPGAASAQPSSNVPASPKPKAVASRPLVLTAKVRGSYYTRQNAINSLQNKANTAVNQESFNLGLTLHAEYHLDRRWTAGASYFYANPLSGCGTPVSHLTPPCGRVAAPSLNPDDTIPGFTMSTLDEAYLQYRDARWYGKIGDQAYTSPWAGPADTRLKPAAFRGIDLSYTLGSQWQAQFSDMIAYEPRTSSQFDRVTLITGFPAGNAGVASNIYVPGGTFLANNGFRYGRIGYTSSKKATVNAQYYAFDRIANLFWAEARVPFGGASKPFVAAHFGREQNAGSSLVGKIDATVLGALAGVNVTPRLLLSVGYDTIPVRTDTIALPAGYSCKSGTINGTANAAGGVSLPYFLPSGGTANCSPAAGGKTNIYYGGIASPYTDNYTADPMYTTSLTQGMVERRSPGSALKATLTFTSPDKRLITYVSRAFYNYDNPGYAQGTYETDFDLTYDLNKLPKDAAYRGVFFRYRYGERTQSGNASLGGPPLFKNNRFQLEYDL